MAFTEAGSSMVLKSFVGQGASVLLSSCYMGLSSTIPSSDGSNFTEPSGGGYARTIVGIDGQSATQLMSTPENGTTSNEQIIYFPEATSSWGTLSYFGLFARETATEPLIYGALTSSVTVGANYVPLFRVGNFSLTLS